MLAIMTTWKRVGDCECESIFGCPARIDAEIQHLEEIVIMKTAHPCMSLTEAQARKA